MVDASMQIVESVKKDILAGHRIRLSFRICKHFQKVLKDGWGIDTKIGFVSARNVHSPFLILDNKR